MTDERQDAPERVFEAGADRAGYVREMFGEISGRYDLMNRVMTVGQDLRWRRRAANAVVRAGDTVADLGSGTGDLAFACLEAGAARVVGLDVAGPMLARARTKGQRVAQYTGFALGDATRLPLSDGRDAHRTEAAPGRAAQQPAVALERTKRGARRRAASAGHRRSR